jgi:hypothetical protein
MSAPHNSPFLRARIREAAERDPAVRFPLVSRPVDCGDTDAYPEIARAVAHAKALRGEA